MDYKKFTKIILSATIVITLTSIASAFFVGFGIGLSSFKYYIIIAAIVGIVAYFFFKEDKTGKRRLLNFFSISVMLSIIFFILLSLGNCVGSCTKGGGDLRQQRIEMGLPLY